MESRADFPTNERSPSDLRSVFGEFLQEHVPLARYTAARVGGPADALLVANTTDDLSWIVARLWELGETFHVLGGGSNVLVSDAGVRGVVVVNRARQVRFDEQGDPPTVWAESGANLGSLARQAASRGLGGLEWAVGIPGTVGGAIVGNAGAHGGDIAGNLLVAEILHRNRVLDQVTLVDKNVLDGLKETWVAERLEFSYRSSALKRQHGQAVILSAQLRLEISSMEQVQAKIDEFTEHRRRTQPPGASMGSMFKNPPGDYAGRLIDAAGLKGTCIGDAEISPLHANFFINHGQATAADIYKLITVTRDVVLSKYGVALDLEIELIGEWNI